MLHKINGIDFRIIQHSHASIDNFRQVVGRDIGRHTDSDAGRTIYQKVRETAGQNSRLFPGFVKVRIPVNGILVDIPQHLIGKLRHSCFRITVSCRGVSVHRTEVTVAIHQHITHREVLCKTHHCVVYCRITVGVIFTDNITDTGCRLSKGLVRCKTGFVHRIQNTTVNRL